MSTLGPLDGFRMPVILCPSMRASFFNAFHISPSDPSPGQAASMNEKTASNRTRIPQYDAPRTWSSLLSVRNEGCLNAAERVPGSARSAFVLRYRERVAVIKSTRCMRAIPESTLDEEMNTRTLSSEGVHNLHSGVFLRAPQ